MSDVIYLYGFVPANTAAPPAALRGIGGAPVTLVEAGGVHAAVSHVPASELDPDTLESRLTDLAWVGEQGLAHERVVIWFADNADIVPARLFTLHTSESALRDAVVAQQQKIAASLHRLTGRREWNLKVAHDPERLAVAAAELSEEVARADAEIAAASPGRRYLLQRGRTELVRREVGNIARRLAAELLDRLAPCAERVQTLPLAESDRGGTVVLNAALLVPREREEELRSAAGTHAAAQQEQGMIVTFSGPWAPYRFVDIDGTV